MRLRRRVLAVPSAVVLIVASLVAGRGPARRNDSDPAGQGQTDKQGASASSKAAAPAQGAHRDHNPKHGGTFFMSMDYKHHLEGVLVPPATFRIYLYDERTKPLRVEQTRLASGTVQVGDSDAAPKIKLVPGMEKETLEAKIGDGVKFPVAITLLLHLPGMEPNAEPEIFNFNFTRFTVENGPGPRSPMAGMTDMPCKSAQATISGFLGETCL